MLTPSVKDKNYEKELKRKSEHPEDWGPSRPVDMDTMKRQQSDAKKSSR